MEYDVIGDIHGQAGKLEALLARMGYVRKGRSWVPPMGRQAIFLGDLIDRGPEQVRVIEIVHSMMGNGHAQSIMGNHELNAICYTVLQEGTTATYLRRHSIRNTTQHAEFLRQVVEGSTLHKQTLEWFRTLPPCLDLGGIRVAHAWWSNSGAALLARYNHGAHNPMDDDFLRLAHTKGAQEEYALRGVTKGFEIRLPEGHSYLDESKIERFMARTRWWLPKGKTFKEVAIVHGSYEAPDISIPRGYWPAPVVGSPIFVGHYWMTGKPSIQTPKVACLDYSAAKDGPLVGYRWSGEDELSNENFVVSHDTEYERALSEYQDHEKFERLAA